jgi:hypothetical protein
VPTTATVLGCPSWPELMSSAVSRVDPVVQGLSSLEGGLNNVFPAFPPSPEPEMLPPVVLANSPTPAPLPSSSAPVKPFSFPPLLVLEKLPPTSQVAPSA